MRFLFTNLCLLGCLYLLSAQAVTTLISTETEINYEAISWHTDGRIYTPDFINGRLYQINPDGTRTTLLSDLVGPLGGAFDPAGNFYFSEYYTGKIHRLTPTGEHNELASGFGGPTGMIYDTANHQLYVSDYNTTRIRILDLDTNQGSVLVIDSLLNGPDGIVFAPNGDLIVANFNDNKVNRITAEGVISPFTTLSGTGDSGYLVNYGDGYLISGLNSNRIFYLDAMGNASIWAGAGSNSVTDGALLTATFSAPNGIGISPGQDSVIITDGGRNGSIRLVTGINPVSSSRNFDLAQQFNLSISPNPARDRLIISYRLEESKSVQVSLLHMDGRLVKVWSDKRQNAGLQEQSLALPGNLTNGQYQCIVTVGQHRVARTVMINR